MIKHFIDINDFSKKELDLILNQAKQIKNKKTKYKNVMNSKSLGLLFHKESTRTRLSFAIGMQKLGGNVMDLDLKNLGFGKRESEEDIIKTLSLYLDCLVVRNNDGQIINVTENTAHGSFIPHMISDHVFDTLMGEKEIITIDSMEYEKSQWKFRPS